MAMIPVRKIEVTTIKPSRETPNHVLYLSEQDNLSNYFVPLIIVYEGYKKEESNNPAKVLREALGKVLVYYYPLAGVLKKANDVQGPGKFEVDCNAQGVLFAEAEADCMLEDVGYFMKTPLSWDSPLLLYSDPDLPREQIPFLRVQTIGYRAEHVVGAGSFGVVFQMDQNILSIGAATNAETMPTHVVPISEGNATALATTQENLRTNLRWKEREDDVLIDCLLDAIGDGRKKSDNGWISGTISHVAKKMMAVYPSADIREKHVHNRMKTLKSHYVIVKQAASQSGFSMTSDGRIEADKDAWDAYVVANPKAKPFRHVGIRNYDKLCIIFGADQANGNLSYEAHDEVPLSQLNLDSGTQGDTSDAHEHMNVDSETPYEAAHKEHPASGGTGAASGGGQSSGKNNEKAIPHAGQKRRRSLPGYDKYDDTLLLMAEAANNMSTSVKELTSTLKKPALPRLLPILKGIPELSYGDITRAMIVFGRDLSAADILVSMEEGMRYEFVRSMLG